MTIMSSGVRKLALTAHVTSSVGWLGAVVAYLALAIVSLRSPDAQRVRAAYLAMEVVGWFVIVPASLAALLSGFVQSIGTEWGLLRHRWIVAKVVLTVPATVVLLLHMPVVSRVAGVAARGSLSGGELGGVRVQLLVHATGGLLVLLMATVLSVYKPWGMTSYGRRTLSEQRRHRATGNTPSLVEPIGVAKAGSAVDLPSRAIPARKAGVIAAAGAREAGTRCLLYAAVALVALVALVVLHLAARGGFGGH